MKLPPTARPLQPLNRSAEGIASEPLPTVDVRTVSRLSESEEHRPAGDHGCVPPLALRLRDTSPQRSHALSDQRRRLAWQALDAFRANAAAGPMVRSTGFRHLREARSIDDQATSLLPEITQLCQLNLQTLKRRIGPLNGDEQRFVRAVESAPWHLTHATHHTFNDGEFELLSSKRLGDEVRRHPGTAHDVEHFANDGYVYLALEATESPQKRKSRFGPNIYRMPLEGSSIAQQRGILVLKDLVYDSAINATAFSHSGVHKGDLANLQIFWSSSGTRDASTEALGTPDLRAKDADKDFSLIMKQPVPDRCLFEAGSTREALALAVILSARALREPGLLSLDGKDDAGAVNRVVNGLLRPQVMVPSKYADQRAALVSPKAG